MRVDFFLIKGHRVTVTTFLERAIHSFTVLFHVICLFVASIIYHFGFEGRVLVLIVSGHDLLY